MRTQDIVLGESYRLRTSTTYAYAKALEIIKVLPKYRQKTEVEKEVKCTVVKCEWIINKTDKIHYIRYFRPCDLIKEEKAKELK